MGILNSIFGKKKDNSRVCPYCGFIFEEMPKRKRKCPECKNSVYVLNDGKKSKLITEEQREETKLIEFLNSVDFSKKQYDDYKKSYYAKQEDKANYKDFQWSLYNYLINEKAKIDDFHSMKQVYFSMANSVREKDPEQYNKLRKAMVNTYLLEAQKSEFRDQSEIVIIAGDSCTSCNELSKRTYTIPEALKEQPLPNPNCTHERGCMCSYAQNITGDIF